MKVLIIGSGISAILVAKTFLEYDYKVYLVDSENYSDKVEYKKKVKFLPNINQSPKFQNKTIKTSFVKFKKKYKIKTKNFYLVSSLISGGLSNFWGAGIEIPKLDYLKKYSFGKSILKEKNYIDNEIGVNANMFNFYNFFYKQKIIKTFLKKKDKSIYFSKLPLALRQFGKKKLSISDYDNLDLLSTNINVYNAKFQIPKLLKYKNFNYISNTFVSNIIRDKKSYKLITESKKKINLKFDKVVISAGTVGSTILVDKILGLSEKYRLFHTPIVKLMYFSFLLPFKMINKYKFGLPLLNLNIHIQNKKFIGSFIYLRDITNYFFGVRKTNILFSLIKKFFFVGNIFLPSSYSQTYIHVQKHETLIYSNNDFTKKNFTLNLKKKINLFLKKYNLFEFSSQNFKFLDNGSDAHYTSTLVSSDKNGKKLIGDNCELNNFKNVHIIDGSTIREGLCYPTYFLMMHARFITKKIINNDKKN